MVPTAGNTQSGSMDVGQACGRKPRAFSCKGQRSSTCVASAGSRQKSVALKLRKYASWSVILLILVSLLPSFLGLWKKSHSVNNADFETDDTKLNIWTREEELVESNEPSAISEISGDDIESETQSENTVTRYCKQFLSSDEALAYTMIVEAAESFEDSVILTGLAGEDVEHLWTSVYNDYPELFWLKNDYSWTSYSDNGIPVTTLSLNYSMDLDEAARAQEKIDGIVASLKDQYGTKSQYEKVKGIYEYVINNTAYDYAYDDQSMCSALIEGRAVCAGYARSVQYLLQSLDIEAVYVSGTMNNGEDHGWNIVRIGNSYYHVDATHGDPLFDDGHQELFYDYLCLTSDEVLRTRIIDEQFPVPACSNIEHNYFITENKYLGWYDTDRVAELLIESVQTGMPCDFKVSDESLMNEVTYRLFDNSELWELIHRVEEELGITVSRYNYNVNQELYSIRIVLEY